MLAIMYSVLGRPWTTEPFLAWEDHLEGKHEFDGRTVIAMTGGGPAHQDIVFNLRGILARLQADKPFRVVQEMRLRIGAVCAIRMSWCVQVRSSRPCAR